MPPLQTGFHSQQTVAASDVMTDLMKVERAFSTSLGVAEATDKANTERALGEAR